MLPITLTPKNKKRYFTNKEQKKPVPDNWPDFARLCDIRSGTRLIKFDPYPFQVQLIEQVDRHKTTVICKPRQQGITETITNYFLFKACKNAGYLAVIFSKSQSDTSNIAKRLRRQIESLTEYTTTKTDSLTDIELVNGGRLLFRNSTPNGARGLESVSDILYDEASFTDDVEEIYKSSIPCTTLAGDDAKIIILSTPNGRGNWYFDKLQNNNDGIDLIEVCEKMKTGKIAPVQTWTDKNDWCKFLIHWRANPTVKNPDSYLQKIKQSTGLSDVVIEQEYNLSFTDSDQLVFSSLQVRQCAIGELEKEYDCECDYFIGVDTANLGNDYTVAIVVKFDGVTYSVVSYYRKRKSSSEYDLFQISELIETYNPVSVGIEITGGTGQVYLEQLVKQHPSLNFEAIKTTQQSKLTMIERIIMAMDKQILIYPFKSPLVSEFLTFKRVGNRLEASNNDHDDCVMALGFALAVSPLKVQDSSKINLYNIKVI